jgi:hypothetical protein
LQVSNQASDIRSARRKPVRFIPLVLAGSFCLFMLQSLGRSIYIDRYEFEPARLEWEAAHARNDRDGMWAAYHKEEKAHDRSFDPLWFVDYFKSGK